MKNFRSFRTLTGIVVLSLLGTSGLWAQTPVSVKVGQDHLLTFGGFLRVDHMFDSRQTSEAAEGLFTFYPLAPAYDELGKDLNSSAKNGFSSIASRLTTTFTGVEVLDAQMRAYIEFDFTSVLSGTTGVRLRQAFLEFNWPKTRVLFGQAWHPLSANVIPTIIGLNTGAPFWAFNRSPQLRIDYKTGKFLLTLAHVYQADFASPGPLATVKSSEYQRNALLPQMVASIRYGDKLQVGLAGETKTIKPRNFTTNQGGDRFKTSEKLTSFSGQAWFYYNGDKLQLKGETLYGQNMYDSFMFGGYGIHSIDPATGKETYTATQHSSSWINLTYGEKWRGGLFAGYIKNLGTTKIVPGGASGFFGREPGLKQMWRLAPHVLYTQKNFQWGAETEISTAYFGTILPGTKGDITGAKSVTNVRFQLSMTYNF